MKHNDKMENWKIIDKNESNKIHFNNTDVL